MLRGTNNDNEVSLKACVSADQSAALMAALSLLWELDPWRGVFKKSQCMRLQRVGHDRAAEHIALGGGPYDM